MNPKYQELAKRNHKNDLINENDKNIDETPLRIQNSNTNRHNPYSPMVKLNNKDDKNVINL